MGGGRRRRREANVQENTYVGRKHTISLCVTPVFGKDQVIYTCTSHIRDFRSKRTLERRYTVIIITVCVNIKRWTPFFIPILCVSLFSLFLLHNIHFTTQAIVVIDCRCCSIKNLQENTNKGSIISSFAVRQRHKTQPLLKGGTNK